MASGTRLTWLLVIVGLVAAFGVPARASAQSDRFLRALAEFREAAQGTDGDEGRELPGLLDEMRRGLSSWTAAARSAEASLRADLQAASGEAAARLHLQLGLSYLQQNRVADALDAFDAGTKAVPDDRALHLFRGLVLERLDRSEEANRAFEQAFALDPGDPVTAYLVIATATPGTNVERALETLQRLERDVTRGVAERAATPFVTPAAVSSGTGGSAVFAPHRYAAAYARHSEGAHEEAIEQLRHAMAADPLVVDPAAKSDALAAAVASLQQRQVGAALEALETLLERMPESSETHRLLARVYGIAGDVTSSVAHSEMALELQPDDERTWIALARLQGGLGDDAEAMRTLERATQALPESGELQWMLASLAFRLERTGDALAAAEAAARAPVISGQDELLRSIVHLAKRHQDLAQAISVSKARIRLDRNNPVAHRELAMLYTDEGRHRRALAELAVAAWLEPDDPHTFVALGRTHTALGRTERAVAALQRAVALDPTLASGRYALAQALVRAGRRSDSHPHLAEFQRLSAAARETERHARSVAALLRTARLHALDGGYEHAADAYRALIALEPRLVQGYLELARVLEEAGRLEESVEPLLTAAKLDNRPGVYLRVASILAKLDRPDDSEKAREAYEWLRLHEMERHRRQ